MSQQRASEGTLHGKRIVLIEGTSAVGMATATAALREGASLVITSSGQACLDRALTRFPEETQGHVLNLTSEDLVQRFFASIGAYDHLVISDAEPFSFMGFVESSLEEVKDFFDARFWGTYTAAKCGHRLIRPGGSIVLTSGIASIRPQKGWTAAACLCGATDSLTRALAVELAPLRVNAVAPGIVRSALSNRMSSVDLDPMQQAMSEALPLGKVGDVEDIAEAYLFLMRSRYSTGQVLVVDGGAVLA